MWIGPVEPKYHKTNYFNCAVIVQVQKRRGLYIFREENLFPYFQKNSSIPRTIYLSLTRLPAIFTQLKLQMIHSILLQLCGTWPCQSLQLQEQGCQTTGTLGLARQSDRERQRNEIKGSEKGWETLWGLILFPLPVALLWTESEWNYCAFIRQTAGPLWSLKAT